MHWSMITTTILTLVNHVYADPATLDFSVLANLEFDQIDGDIGFIRVLSCTESKDNSNFTYPLGISEMAELEPYVISVKIVPEYEPVETIIIGTDDYALQTVTCSNPVISVTQSLELSFTVDYPNLASVRTSNSDNYLGSDTAKSRLFGMCLQTPRSIRNYQYHACGSGNLKIYSLYNVCVWDTSDVTNGESIAIYYGFDVNREKVCAESGGLGPGNGSFYTPDPCLNVTCPDTGNLCTENVCIDGICVLDESIVCGFGEVCNSDNGECEVTDCDVFDIDKYTETCSVNDIIGRIEALEKTENNSTLQLQGDIGTLKTENIRLQNEIITLQGEIDTLKLEDSGLQDDIDTLNIENSALQGEIDTLKTENSGLQNEIITLQGEIDTLKSENSTLQLQGEIDTLKIENSALQDEIDTLKTEDLGLQDEIDTLKTENSGLKDEIDTLKTENLGLQDEIDALKTEDLALQDEIDTLKTENSGLQDEILALNATIEAIDDRIDNLEIQQPPPPPPPPKGATP